VEIWLGRLGSRVEQKMKLVSVLAAMIAIGCCTAEASIMIKITESGSDVLFTTTGSLDTSGLTGHANSTNGKSVTYNNAISTWKVWVAFGGSNQQDFYAGAGDGLVNYTSNVSWTGGSVGGLGVDLVSGSADFGFRTGSLESIWIPDQYVSGSSVSQVLRRNNASLATLGLNIGDFAEVSWDTGGASRESIRMQVGDGFSPVPEPSAIAMWGIAGALGLVLAHRRKRTIVA